MAISRHDPEWQHTIAEAALGGVRFEQISPKFQSDTPRRHWRYMWRAILPNGRIWQAESKIAAARAAIGILRGEL